MQLSLNFTYRVTYLLLLIYIKNNKGHEMDPCGIPARISSQDEHSPFLSVAK